MPTAIAARTIITRPPIRQGRPPKLVRDDPKEIAKLEGAFAAFFRECEEKKEAPGMYGLLLASGLTINTWMSYERGGNGEMLADCLRKARTRALRFAEANALKYPAGATALAVNASRSMPEGWGWINAAIAQPVQIKATGNVQINLLAQDKGL